MKYILRYNNNKYRYSTNRECHLLTLILNNHFLSPFALLGLVRSEAGKAGYSPAYNLRGYGSVHFIMCSRCRTKSMCQTVLDDSQVLPCPFFLWPLYCCIVCSSSIYGLPLWYFKSLLVCVLCLKTLPYRKYVSNSFR